MNNIIFTIDDNLKNDFFKEINEDSDNEDENINRAYSINVIRNSDFAENQTNLFNFVFNRKSINCFGVFLNLTIFCPTFANSLILLCGLIIFVENDIIKTDITTIGINTSRAIYIT